MLGALLRKLKLGRAVYGLAQPFLPRRRETMEPDEAMERLLSVCPDGHGSCIKEPGETEGAATEAELDIIIPAYNAEKYLRGCLDSVLTQETKHSYRVIVIDDGSTDGTAEILRDYAGDGRLLIRRQENRGFSGARNAGLSLSAAGHVLFLDSDDMLAPGAIERLMDQAGASGLRMVEGAYERMDGQGRSLGRTVHRAGPLEPARDCNGYVWGCLLPAALLRGLRLPEGYWYEDSVKMMIWLPLLQREGGVAWGISETAVRYRANPMGISRQGKSSPKCIDSLWVHMQLARDREALGIPKTQDYYEYLLRALLLTGRRTAEQPEEIRRAVFTAFGDFIQRECPGYRTGDGLMRGLEEAVGAGDYGRYKLLCALA